MTSVADGNILVYAFEDAHQIQCVENEVEIATADSPAPRLLGRLSLQSQLCRARFVWCYTCEPHGLFVFRQMGGRVAYEAHRLKFLYRLCRFIRSWPWDQLYISNISFVYIYLCDHSSGVDTVYGWQHGKSYHKNPRNCIQGTISKINSPFSVINTV